MTFPRDVPPRRCPGFHPRGCAQAARAEGASAPAERTKSRAASVVAKVGDQVKAAVDGHREPSAAPPPPSAASGTHSAQAAADFAKNAPPSEPKHGTRGFFVAGGAGFAAAIDSTAIGGQVSGGGLLAEDGTVRPFVSGGAVTAGVGLSAGVGAELGYVHDSDAFYGRGEQLSVSIGPFSASLGFTSDGKVNSASVGVGKSSGVPGAIVQSSTDTVGTAAQMKKSGTP